MLLRAIEEKRFYPLGSDREVQSDFQLIAGTNRDLSDAIRAGTFREDLLARINIWTFDLPGLAQRREDIAPNIVFELNKIAEATGQMYRFNREAHNRFLAFATASESAWSGNFRDLNAALARMATMSPTGRITLEVVEGEIHRLRRAWQNASPAQRCDDGTGDLATLLGDRLETIDEFDRVQRAHVVRMCRASATLSAAGRRLFAASRAKRRAVNDADRLRKYLERFGLTWSQLMG